MSDYDIESSDFEITSSRDGSLILTCGKEGMETDLVFAGGAMDKDDPLLEKQRAILEFIITAIYG